MLQQFYTITTASLLLFTSATVRDDTKTPKWRLITGGKMGGLNLHTSARHVSVSLGRLVSTELIWTHAKIGERWVVGYHREIWCLKLELKWVINYSHSYDKRNTVWPVKLGKILTEYFKFLDNSTEIVTVSGLLAFCLLACYHPSYFYLALQCGKERLSWRFGWS